MMHFFYILGFDFFGLSEESFIYSYRSKKNKIGFLNKESMKMKLGIWIIITL